MKDQTNLNKMTEMLPVTNESADLVNTEPNKFICVE